MVASIVYFVVRLYTFTSNAFKIGYKLYTRETVRLVVDSVVPVRGQRSSEGHFIASIAYCMLSEIHETCISDVMHRL